MLTDRAQDVKTEEIVALKKMRMENEKNGEKLLLYCVYHFGLSKK